MSYLFTNFARSTLQSSINNVVTSLSVSAGTGALFPSPSGGDVFMIVLVNNLGQREIMQVTARSGDNFTVVRGQEGTTAMAFTAGDRVSHRITAATINAAFGVSVPSAAGHAGEAIISNGTTAAYGTSVGALWELSGASPILTLNAAASGQARQTRYRTAGVTRWTAGANGTAEAGSSSGSDYAEQAYDDAGASLGTWRTTYRATGKTVWSAVPAASGTMWDHTVSYDNTISHRTYNSNAGSNATARTQVETNDGVLSHDAHSTAKRTATGIGAGSLWSGSGKYTAGTTGSGDYELWANNAARVRITSTTCDILAGSGSLRVGGHITRAMLGPITIRSSAGQTAVGAHGGTRAPDGWKIRVRITSATAGYSVGDITEASVIVSNGVSAAFDATNAWILQPGGTITIANKTTGATASVVYLQAELYLFCEWW